MAERQWIFSADKQSASMKLAGEVDYTITSEVRVLLHRAIEESSGDVTLDLSELTYVDSSGLAVLIEAYKLLAAKGRAITLTGVSPQVEKILRLTQVQQLFGL